MTSSMLSEPQPTLREPVLAPDPLALGALRDVAGEGPCAFTLIASDEDEFRARCAHLGLRVRTVVPATGGRRCAVVTDLGGPGSWRAGKWLALRPATAAGALCDHVGAAAVSRQLAFAEALRGARGAAFSEEPVAALVCDVEPREADGLVALPHLVVVLDGESLRDAILWEALEPTLLERLTGRADFDLGYWRDRLDRLLAVKSSLRERGGDTERGFSQLVDALSGRYLSFRFVLQHEGLMRAVVDGAAA